MNLKDLANSVGSFFNNAGNTVQRSTQQVGNFLQQYPTPMSFVQRQVSNTYNKINPQMVSPLANDTTRRMIEMPKLPVSVSFNPTVANTLLKGAVPAYGLYDTLKQLPKQLQQTELARINYQREGEQGLVGKRLMSNPITYMGAGRVAAFGNTLGNAKQSVGKITSGQGKPVDFYNLAKVPATAYSLTPGGALGDVIAGGLGVGMKGIENVVSGQPFFRNYGETFGKSADDMVVANVLFKYNPIFKQALERVPLNKTQVLAKAAVAGLRDFVTGAIMGAATSENKQQMPGNVLKTGAQYGAFGFATQGVTGTFSLLKNSKTMAQMETAVKNILVEQKGLAEKEALPVAKKYVRDIWGQFAEKGLKPTSGDLNESMGLPRNPTNTIKYENKKVVSLPQAKVDAQPPFGDVEAKQIQQTAIKNYGTTNVPESASFVTQDGKIIDSSGKKLGSMSEGRNVDHREIAVSAIPDNVTTKGMSGSDALSYFMDKTNATRVNVMPDEINIDTIRNLSDAQLKQLEKLSQGKTIVADISKLDGSVAKSGTFKTFSEYKNWLSSNFSPPLSQSTGGVGGVKTIPDIQTQRNVAPVSKIVPKLQTELPITNKPLSTNASTPIITTKSTPESVVATLPARVNSFVEKTLGYSTEAPTGGTKQASTYTKILRGGQEKITRGVEKGMASENALVRNAATTLQNFFRGMGMSPERSTASMNLRGGMSTANERAAGVMDSLYKSLNRDKGSLERINAVLDPEMAKTKVSFKDLTSVEQSAYKIIREGLDIVHDTSFANGHISQELYLKNKGKYTPRLYDVMEMPPEVNKFVTQGKKIVNDLYKQRTAVTDWKTEHALNDPVYSLGKRLAQVETNSAIKKYTDFLAQNTRFISNVERPGFTKLSDSPAYGALKGKYVLNSAAEDLKGFFFSNQAAQNLYDVFRAYDRMPIRQLQKKLLTVFNPTTNVGNIVSDQVFGFVTGVDPLTLNKNLIEVKTNKKLYSQLSDYLMRKGIVGTDITRTDFVNKMGQIDEMAAGKTPNIVSKVAGKVQSFYGGTDDAYKVSAFKALLDKGFTLEEATRKVADGFQNYANVGKFYDVWAKTPVVGSAFIKFQGDLIRIIKNGAMNNPLGLMTFLGTLWGVARLSSKLSGETDENRQYRENRFGAPMIPGLKIPLTWQTPWGEINAARYISPFFANNEITNVAKMIPFVPTINPKKDVATNIAINANDPFLSTPLQLLVNRDFRGKPISDPNENKYQPSNLTPQERLINQAKFAGRAYTPPPINSAIDVVSAAQGGTNMYGAKQSVPQAVARLGGVKIQQYGPEEVASAKLKDAEFQQYANEAIDKQINSVYKQQLKGEITPQQVKDRVNNLQSQKKNTTVGGNENKFRYLDKNGSMQTVDLNFQPTPPKLTGLTELDKKSISKFNGEITAKANDIYDLYKAGYLTQDEANTQLSNLKNLKLSGAKKPKKISVGKISFKKLKVTLPKATTIKALKISALPKPKTTKSKVKGIKVSPIKVAKIKGLTNGVKLV